MFWDRGDTFCGGELFKIKLYIFRLSLFLNLEAHFFDIGHVFNIEINFLKIKKVKAFRGGILTFYSRSSFLSICWRTLFDLGLLFMISVPLFYDHDPTLKDQAAFFLDHANFLRPKSIIFKDIGAFQRSGSHLWKSVNHFYDHD